MFVSCFFFSFSCVLSYPPVFWIGLGGTVECALLEWSDPATFLKPSFDVVIAADVLYHTDGADLAAAIEAHAGPGTVVYLGYVQ